MKRSSKEGWGDGTDVARVIRRKVTEKVTGVVAGGNRKKKAEALEDAAAKGVAIVLRHQRDWEAHHNSYTVDGIAKDFEIGKSAKICAEMLAIRQKAERAAHGLEEVPSVVVTRIHQRVVNRRRDWFFKLAHELTNQYDQLFFEDLAMKGMQALWGRKVGDLARSEFMGILGYVAATKGKVVHLVNRFYPSSKTCADCGHVHHELSLADRRWVCVGCGVIHDRDHNAAVNIHREGASSLRLGDVRPSLTAIAARP